MPVLTKPGHEAFAQALARGLSASEAYVAAGYKNSRSAASRLSTNVNVLQRVSELQAAAARKTVITIEDIARQLDEDREYARQNGSASAAVTATMGKAKVLGLIVEKNEHTGKDGQPIESRVEHVVDAKEIASAMAKLKGL